MLTLIGEYNPRKPEYMKWKIEFLHNLKRLIDGRETIIDAFKNKVFSFKSIRQFEDEDEDENSSVNMVVNLINKKEGNYPQN